MLPRDLSLQPKAHRIWTLLLTYNLICMGLTARARKRQMKEVRAMLDGTEKSFDEKLRLLNSKYLQQVYLHFPSHSLHANSKSAHYSIKFCFLRYFFKAAHFENLYKPGSWDWMQVSETKQLEKELLTLRRKCDQVNKEKDTSRLLSKFAWTSPIMTKDYSFLKFLNNTNVQHM